MLVAQSECGVLAALMSLRMFKVSGCWCLVNSGEALQVSVDPNSSSPSLLEPCRNPGLLFKNLN